MHVLSSRKYENSFEEFYEKSQVAMLQNSFIRAKWPDKMVSFLQHRKVRKRIRKRSFLWYSFCVTEVHEKFIFSSHVVNMFVTMYIDSHSLSLSCWIKPSKLLNDMSILPFFKEILSEGLNMCIPLG